MPFPKTAEDVVESGPKAKYRRRLSVAVEELVEDGVTYAELSVEQLAEAAGISRSTFYKYFGDKRGLLKDLSAEVEQDFLAAARLLLDLPAGATKDDYVVAFRPVFAGYRQHRVAMWSLAEEARHDSVIAERFAEMMGVFVEAIASHIRRAWSHRTGRPSDEPAALAIWITWMLEDGQARYVARASEAELERHVHAAADVVWRAVQRDL